MNAAVQDTAFMKVLHLSEGGVFYKWLAEGAAFNRGWDYERAAFIRGRRFYKWLAEGAAFNRGWRLSKGGVHYRKYCTRTFDLKKKMFDFSNARQRINYMFSIK